MPGPAHNGQKAASLVRCTECGAERPEEESQDYGVGSLETARTVGQALIGDI